MNKKINGKEKQSAKEGTLATVGLVDVVNRYSPYEVVRKGQTPQGQGMSVALPPVVQAVALPVPVQPSVSPLTATTNTLTAPTAADAVIESLKEKLAKSEEELSKMRRERVDLQSAAAKTRGELQTMARRLETLTSENTRLLSEVEGFRATAAANQQVPSQTPPDMAEALPEAVTQIASPPVVNEKMTS